MYGEPRGHRGDRYMRFGKCMVSGEPLGPGGHMEVWEMYRDRRAIGSGRDCAYLHIHM